MPRSLHHLSIKSDAAGLATSLAEVHSCTVLRGKLRSLRQLVDRTEEGEPVDGFPAAMFLRVKVAWD